jgi:4-aminobutyrate aminotransferase-like enzyme
MPALLPSCPAIERAHGGTVHLVDGQVVIDLCAQTMNLALGHSNAAVMAAVARQLELAQFASSRFGTPTFIELSRRLVELAPMRIKAVNLKLSNGSDAVESAYKLAVLHTRRKTIAALRGAWHGETYLTLGITGNQSGRLIAAADVTKSTVAPTIRSLANLVRRDGRLAAAIIDPAGVSNGLFRESEVMPALADLRAACDETGTVLIFDEVQTFGGFLGPHLYASELVQVEPDIICLGKALGAGFPLAAVLCADQFSNLLQHDDGVFTYGGHAVACAAGLAGLAEFERLRSTLGERVLAFNEMLSATIGRSRDKFDVRSFGLMASLRLTSPRLREAWTARTVRECQAAGIYVRAVDKGRAILIKPPIVLPLAELEPAIERFEEVAGQCAARLRSPMLLSRMDVESPEAAEFLGIVRKPVEGRNKHAGYVSDLLEEYGAGSLSVGQRTAFEQEMLTRRLVEAGVSAIPVYASVTGEWIEYEYLPGRTLQQVINDRNVSAGMVDGLVMRHYEMVVLAHDNDLLMGDRWAGNAIVGFGAGLALIDFDLTYDGDLAEALLFEEVFSIVQLTVIIKSRPLRRDLCRRLGESLRARHGEARAQRAVLGMAAFYLGARRNPNETSFAVDTYRQVLDELRPGGRVDS